MNTCLLWAIYFFEVVIAIRLWKIYDKIDNDKK